MEKICEGCGIAFTKRLKEKPYEFAKRRFCSQRCSVIHTMRKPKSNKTKQRMSESAKNRTPEHIAKITKSRKEFYKTEAGKQSRQQTIEGHKKWRKENPSLVNQMIDKQTQSRYSSGTYEANRDRMIEFYKTPEGQAHKDKLSKERSGKSRPPYIAEKSRQALREYWDSPAGYEHRERISKERTQDMPFAPYGPGWIQKRSKIRDRDKVCVICQKNNQTHNKRNLDIHHIYARRLFGYIPGQNRNYIWANHNDNLVALCSSCHQKVEMDSEKIPQQYQERADIIWKEFTRQLS